MIKSKNKRVSKNIIDVSKGSEKTKSDLTFAHQRQIFDKPLSEKLTKVANRVVHADPLRAKGPGMTKLRSPAKKVQYNKFSMKKGSK